VYLFTLLQEGGIKNQKLEHEKLGLNIYDMQKNVMKMQSLIDNYHETISSITRIRQEMEGQLEIHRNTCKTEQERLNNDQNEGYKSMIFQ
jgi:hypothetical protein